MSNLSSGVKRDPTLIVIIVHKIIYLYSESCFNISGQYKISDVARISFLLYEMFGKIVALRGLIGRPDLLFVYDADEIEKIYRHEGPTPFRPSMPCLVKYKSEVRKDFFGRLAGVVGVYVFEIPPVIRNKTPKKVMLLHSEVIPNKAKNKQIR